MPAALLRNRRGCRPRPQCGQRSCHYPLCWFARRMEIEFACPYLVTIESGGGVLERSESCPRGPRSTRHPLPGMLPTEIGPVRREPPAGTSRRPARTSYALPPAAGCADRSFDGVAPCPVSPSPVSSLERTLVVPSRLVLNCIN